MQCCGFIASSASPHIVTPHRRTPAQCEAACVVCESQLCRLTEKHFCAGKQVMLAWAQVIQAVQV